MSDYQSIFNPLKDAGFTLVPTAAYTASLAGTPTSEEITTALGYTPYDASNPDGFLTSADAVMPFNTRTGAVTLTIGDVTTVLGYTPVESISGTSGRITSTGGTLHQFSI